MPLVAGDGNDLVAVARDDAGRTAVHRITVMAISSGPQLLILEPADGTVTNRRRIDVAGAVVGGPGSTADGTVLVAGAVTPLLSDGTFRAVDVALVEGANAITVEAVDPRGLESEATVTVVSDRTPPSIALLADDLPLEEGATFARTLTLRVEVTDPGGAIAESRVRLNGEEVSQAATTEIPISADGGYVVAVVTRDGAGNEARAERSFVVDLGGCAVSEIEPASGSTVFADAVTLRGRTGTGRRVDHPGADAGLPRPGIRRQPRRRHLPRRRRAAAGGGRKRPGDRLRRSFGHAAYANPRDRARRGGRRPGGGDHLAGPRGTVFRGHADGLGHGVGRHGHGQRRSSHERVGGLRGERGAAGRGSQHPRRAGGRPRGPGGL